MAHEELTIFGDQAEAVLDCTGGWYATATWEGVRLDRLLPPGAAGSVVVTCDRYAPPPGGRRRDAAAGHPPGRRPLSAATASGPAWSPPGRRGFWWSRVVSVELDPAAWWRQPLFLS